MPQFRAVALAIVAVTSMLAQVNTTPVGPTLEAAAIKPAPPGAVPIVPGNWAPPTSASARLRPSTLRTLVMYAFDINPTSRHDPEPVGGPPWLDDNLYELTLKFSALPTVAQSRDLIRMLLEERFRLRWHVETRDLPVYVLTLARPDGRLGAGLKRSKLDCSAYSDTLLRTGRGAVAKEQGADCGVSSGGAPAVVAVQQLTTSMTYPRGAQLIHGSATLREVLTAMQNDRENDRPIIDRTGLTGTYDVDLWWVPARSGVIVADAGDVLPLAVAVQQQLGLKLESRREPRDVIVIDAAELPQLD